MSANVHCEVLLQAPKFQVIRKILSGESSGNIYYVDHPGAVAVLPILDDGRLVFIRNKRRVIEEELLEIPAGTLQPGESPQIAAIRELAEETGFRAENWQEIVEFYVSPGITNEKMTLYFARGLLEGPRNLQPDEDLLVEILTPNDALDALRRGIIRDAKSLIALIIYFNEKNLWPNSAAKQSSSHCPERFTY